LLNKRFVSGCRLLPDIYFHKVIMISDVSEAWWNL